MDLSVFFDVDVSRFRVTAEMLSQTAMTFQLGANPYPSFHMHNRYIGTFIFRSHVALL